jgi:Ca2+/H+ antiporter
MKEFIRKNAKFCLIFNVALIIAGAIVVEVSLYASAALALIGIIGLVITVRTHMSSKPQNENTQDQTVPNEKQDNVSP